MKSMEEIKIMIEYQVEINCINKSGQHTLCVTNQPEMFRACMELYLVTKYVQFGLVIIHSVMII